MVKRQTTNLTHERWQRSIFIFCQRGQLLEISWKDWIYLLTIVIVCFFQTPQVMADEVKICRKLD